VFHHLMHGPVALTLLLIWIAVVALALLLFRRWSRRRVGAVAPAPQKYARRLAKRYQAKLRQAKGFKAADAPPGRDP